MATRSNPSEPLPERPKLKVTRIPAKPMPARFRASIVAPSGQALNAVIMAKSVKVDAPLDIRIEDFDAFCELVAAAQSELHDRARAAE